MCVGDWRLGRFMSVRYTKVPLTANTFQIPANNQRVYLCVMSDTVTDAFQIQSEELDTKGFQIGVITAVQSMWKVTAADDGALPTVAMQLFGLTGLSGPISIVEQFLPEDVLAEEIAKLARGGPLWPK